MNKDDLYLKQLNIYSLIVINKNRVIYRSKLTGLIPLFKAIERKILNQSIIYDKVVGLASAKICHWHNVKQINTLTISRNALEYLENNNIKVYHQKIIEAVIRSNKKECVMGKNR